jgi:NAD(P)-dependent dehydrogenase (short-subunit alcohol dehydrogenase family)
LDRLGEKVFFIAGAGGLGGAAAVRLAREGASVVIGNRHGGEKAREVARVIAKEGGRALGCELEIADEESVAACIALAVDTFGGLDGLLANAAEVSSDVHSRDTNVLDMPMDAFDATLRVNLRGHVLCTRYALPHLLARGGGTLLYTSSCAAYTGEAVRPAYAISKAGLHALVRHVASAWGSQGIRANAIVPGLIMTETAYENTDDAFRQYWLDQQRSFRLGKPEDFAAMVALLFSAEGEWITAQAITIDGGFTLCR